MANKIGDAKVKIGTYTDRNGQVKNRWADLGPAFPRDNGGFSILANPYINLAGLPREDGKDYVTIYIFPPQQGNNGNGGNYGGGYQRGNYGNNQNTNLYRDNGGSRGNMGNINPDPMPLDQPGDTKDIPF